MIVYDQDDAANVALCAWKEARGDGQEAMRAVMHVIANRVGAIGFPADVHRVVFAKNQFTSMSVSSDPEFNLTPQDGDIQYAYCAMLVEYVLRGEDPDPTCGAHYYYNPRTVTSGWFTRVIVGDPEHHPHVATIGKQEFYV